MTIQITDNNEFLMSTNKRDIPILKDLLVNTFGLNIIDIYGYGQITFIPLKQFDDVLRHQIIETIGRIEQNILHLEKCLKLNVA